MRMLQPPCCWFRSPDSERFEGPSWSVQAAPDRSACWWGCSHEDEVQRQYGWSCPAVGWRERRRTHSPIRVSSMTRCTRGSRCRRPTSERSYRTLSTRTTWLFHLSRFYDKKLKSAISKHARQKSNLVAEFKWKWIWGSFESWLPRQPTFGILIQRGRHWSHLSPVTPGTHWHVPVRGSQVVELSEGQAHSAHLKTKTVIVLNQSVNFTCNSVTENPTFIQDNRKTQNNTVHKDLTWKYVALSRNFTFSKNNTARKLYGKLKTDDYNHGLRLLTLTTSWAVAPVALCALVAPSTGHTVAAPTLTGVDVAVAAERRRSAAAGLAALATVKPKRPRLQTNTSLNWKWQKQ